MVSSSSASFDSTQVNNTINNTIKKKISKGRQKIEIKKIEKKDSRLVTFSKRRAGLFKKAVELCVLTGAKIAILVNSPSGKVYVFDEYDLIDSYLNNINDIVETGQLGFQENEFSECYDDVSREMITSSSSNSEEELVDGMNIGQLEEYICSLEEMKKDAVTKADELKMNNNVPAMLGSEEMRKNEAVKANDSVMITNNIPAMLGDVGFRFTA
ncbi:Transcription factor, MADS-box [Artemisia annua]|uniref:Transcription factor, MADS-box n=1 Tax=Artemisia annua TaxID=35608 RepID=A0A2U1LSQ9_ARTAN|nr:Transcription factor, MADS-box [Artemisia annua]